MMFLVTLFGIIGTWIIGIYSSDRMYKLSKKHEDGILANFFKVIDKFLLSKRKKTSVDDIVLIRNTEKEDVKFFSKDYPAFSALGYDSPVIFSKAEHLLIDNDGVRNIRFIQKKILLTVLSLILSMFFGMILFSNSIINLNSEQILVGLSQMTLFFGVLFFLIRYIKNVTIFLDETMAEVKPANVFVSITKNYIITIKSTKHNFIRTADVKFFKYIDSNETEKLIMETKTGSSVLIKYHRYYKDKTYYKVDLKNIEEKLNSILQDMKSEVLESEVASSK